jgi:hypothetical protein
VWNTMEKCLPVLFVLWLWTRWISFLIWLVCFQCYQIFLVALMALLAEMIRRSATLPKSLRNRKPLAEYLLLLLFILSLLVEHRASFRRFLWSVHGCSEWPAHWLHKFYSILMWLPEPSGSQSGDLGEKWPLNFAYETSLTVTLQNAKGWC